MKVCSYGCGQEGKFYFPTADKWCCSKHFRSCPAQRNKLIQYHIGSHRSKESVKRMKDSQVQRSKRIKERKKEERERIKALIGVELCGFGCDQVSKFYLSKIKKFCCESHWNKCPARKIDILSQIKGKKIETEGLCSFGCGQKAKYIFLRSRNYSCSEYLQSCPVIKKKNSETNKIKQAGENNAMFGRIQSEEFKRKNSESNKKAWADPNSIFNSSEFRKKLGREGEKNSMWKGGISFEPYSTDFSNSLKKEIKERDNFYCQNPECNHINKILTVHHIDYNKKNSGRENLITLCNICNTKANHNREGWKKVYSIILENKNLE